MSTAKESLKSNSRGGPRMAGQATTATVRIPRAFLGAGRWRAVRDGSRLGFTGRKMMGLIPVRGHFAEFTFEAQGPSSEAEEETPPRLAIQATSIDTGIKLRDNHLRSRDFLDVEHFPQIEFRAERIEQQARARPHPRAGLIPPSQLRLASERGAVIRVDGGRIEDVAGAHQSLAKESA